MAADAYAEGIIFLQRKSCKACLMGAMKINCIVH